MKSVQLTKKQVVAILTEELSTQYFGLQTIGFIVLLQTIALTLLWQFVLVIALIFGIVEALIIYSMYKKTNGKILDLKKKYGVE